MTMESDPRGGHTVPGVLLSLSLSSHETFLPRERIGIVLLPLLVCAHVTVQKDLFDEWLPSS